MDGLAFNEAEFQEPLNECAITLQFRNHCGLTGLKVCEAGQNDLAEEGNLDGASHLAAQDEARIAQLNRAGIARSQNLHHRARPKAERAEPRAFARMRRNFLNNSRLPLAQVAQGKAFGAADVGGGHGQRHQGAISFRDDGASKANGSLACQREFDSANGASASDILSMGHGR